MRLSNILSGSAFHLAVQLVVLFVIMLLLIGLVLVRVVNHTLEDELIKQTREEVILFREIYQANGKTGLVSVINDLSRTTSNDHARGLFDSNRQHIAGQVSLSPDFIGLQETNLALSRTSADARSRRFHTNVVKLNEMTLVVARSNRMVQDAQRKLVIWLTMSGLGLSAGTLLLGYLASRSSFLKLQAIEQTLLAVSNGDLQVRIETGGIKSQIDRIAHQMNRHLDHLSALVTGFKSTAAAIAHDLKTPLSHARIALFKAMEEGETTETIADALEELEQLNQTFDTVLRISRIQNRVEHAAFARVDLTAVIEKVVDLLKPIAEDAGIGLQHQSSSKASVYLHGDAGMIEQMLVNLTSNAIIHCPIGSEVNLSVEKRHEHVVLIVKDNGYGIPADQRAQVVEPFKRLDNARTSPGSGLGLALVAAIVEHHQATMTLEDAKPGLLVRVMFPSQSAV